MARVPFGRAIYIIWMDLIPLAPSAEKCCGDVPDSKSMAIGTATALEADNFLISYPPSYYADPSVPVP